jgi:hypothetical protein
MDSLRSQIDLVRLSARSKRIARDLRGLAAAAKGVPPSTGAVSRVAAHAVRIMGEEVSEWGDTIRARADELSRG